MNRTFCFFNPELRCIFPIACPRDSRCRKSKRDIPVPNLPDAEQYARSPWLGRRRKLRERA